MLNSPTRRSIFSIPRVLQWLLDQLCFFLWVGKHRNILLCIYVVLRGKPGSLPEQDSACQLLSKRRKRRAANRNPHLEDQPVILEYLALPRITFSSFKLVTLPPRRVALRAKASRYLVAQPDEIQITKKYCTAMCQKVPGLVLAHALSELMHLNDPPAPLHCLDLVNLLGVVRCVR